LFSATNQENIKIMTLKNAFNYFKSLVTETSKKSEIKIYQEFIQIITSLEKRNLSENERQSIEAKLDGLDLDSTTTTRNKKHFNKALQQFKDYLQDSFSLTSKGYYARLGLLLGTIFGPLLGIIILSSFEWPLSVPMGTSFGMITGLLIGRHMDSKVENAGNVL